ncbi:MAG: chemotaxis protein CheA [Syntrophomonadaceae bacterium]|nr:chemotaxis protein CheA [Syntrophomonadaceae bacterium]
MDMSQYLAVFLEESKEHLENLNERLLELEKDSKNLSALDEIFRSAHTLKGMSSTMGFEDLADLTHHMENVLSDLKEGLLGVDSSVVDILFKCFDRVQMIIDEIESGNSGEIDNSDLISILEGVVAGNYNAAAAQEMLTESEGFRNFSEENGENEDIDFKFNDYDITVLKEAAAKGFKVQYIKIQIDKDCLMKSVRAFMVFKTLEEEGEIIKSLPPVQAIEEEKFNGEFELVLVTKSSQEDLVRRLNNISEIGVMMVREIEVDSLAASGSPAASHENNEGVDFDRSRSKQKLRQTIRVDIERLDNLMNLVGELVMHKGRLEQIGISHQLIELNETVEQIDRVSTDLQSVVMKVRMVPVEQVFNRFPRMVRDLAKDLGKEIDFVIEGKETELDRTVIDEIGDPLVHLLRNAIDHGLEFPEERLKNGKPQKGKLVLRASHEGNNVYIEVEDDGMGIDINNVLARGIAKNIIDPARAKQMEREEIIDLLFSPGFSTAQNITDISGRGVGLDVVKSKIEALNGEIYVDSTPGWGTKFKIKLPLTLAIIQALIVAVRDEIYAIPLSSVDETTMISRGEIKTVQNQEVITLRGSILPLFRLANLLEITTQTDDEEEMYVVVVRKGERRIGLVVDALIGQQEIVIKSLGRLLAGIPGIAGAIVAGDGNVRLILDIATLF